MRSGPEIESALTKFVTKWKGYSGSEKSEAQSFLNELFAAYGTDRREVGALFEDFKSSAGFMDLHWPGILIVEMKGPTVSLEKAKEEQRRRYWYYGRVCSFRRDWSCLDHAERPGIMTISGLEFSRDRYRSNQTRLQYN